MPSPSLTGCMDDDVGTARSRSLEASDELLNSGLKALQEWCEPFTAERESGVPVEQDITQEDADYFNHLGRERLRPLWNAWRAALSQVSDSERSSNVITNEVQS